MSGGQQTENTLHENAIGWFILLAVIGVLLAVFWYYYDIEVRNLVRWVRYSEMWVSKIFINTLEATGIFGEGYQVFFRGEQYSWNAGMESTAQYPKEQLTFDHLSFFSALAMQPLKNIFIAMLGLMALWSLFKGPNTKFRSVMGLEALIKRQAEIFPFIHPFVDFNPGAQPPRPPGSPVPAELPIFAEALGPEEWLAYNQIPVPDGKIDEEATFKHFRKQLGPVWRGPLKVEPYKQILLAAFCLKAARKRNDADQMLGRVSLCWSASHGLQLSKDKKLVSEARAILRDKKLSGETLAKINQHAYETTAMLRALETARQEGGVLQSAQFVWLRAHNRRLWYPLGNIGRQSFHMESLGAMSHYKAEKRTSRPIPVPKMEDALHTITEYMSGTGARPIPQLDYSASKKRGIKKAV